MGLSNLIATGILSAGMSGDLRSDSISDYPERNYSFSEERQSETPQNYFPEQRWQGYFNNLSGAAAPRDASENGIYNWSIASPKGELSPLGREILDRQSDCSPPPTTVSQNTFSTIMLKNTLLNLGTTFASIGAGVLISSISRRRNERKKEFASYFPSSKERAEFGE